MQFIVRTTALFLLSLLVASCAGSGSDTSERARTLHSLGFQPVRLQPAMGRDSRVGVDVVVNRVRASLLLDSGANASRISRAVANRAGIRSQKGVTAISRGALGKPVKITQGLGQLRIGDLTVDPFLFSIGDGSSQPTALGLFEGHIGSDGLGLMSGMVDVQRGALWLPSPKSATVKSDGIRPLGFQEGLGLIAKPFQLARGSAHFIIPTYVNGQRLTWVIDTGAEISLLTTQAARRAKIKSAKSNVTILDAHGDRAAVALGRIPELKFGGFTAVGLQVGVSKLPSLSKHFSDTAGRPVDGILGIDFLRQSGALIDAKSKLLYLGNR